MESDSKAPSAALDDPPKWMVPVAFDDTELLNSILMSRTYIFQPSHPHPALLFVFLPTWRRQRKTHPIPYGRIRRRWDMRIITRGYRAMVALDASVTSSQDSQAYMEVNTWLNCPRGPCSIQTKQELTSEMEHEANMANPLHRYPRLVDQ
jgi:hypothetical protein